MRSLVAIFVASVGLTGCWANFSPPSRVGGNVAPGRLEAGQMEVGGSSSVAVTPPVTTTTTIGGAAAYSQTDMYYTVMGSPSFAVALSDKLQLEAAGDFGMGVRGAFGMRLNWNRRKSGAGGAADLEMGASAGMGGIRAGEVTLNNPSVGGYLGGGVARYFSEKSALFLRGRIQGSKAESLPATFWGSTLVGFDIHPEKSFNINLGAGLMCYANQAQGFCGFLFDVGIAFEFDVFTPKKPPKQEEEKPVVPETASADERRVEPVPAVKILVPPRPCPHNSNVHGGYPPDAFELYCAKRGPRGREIQHGLYIGYYENGEKASEGEYKDGLRDGEWTFRYDDGRIRLDAAYRMGKKHGRWVFRGRDGSIQRVVEYADDRMVSEERS